MDKNLKFSDFLFVDYTSGSTPEMVGVKQEQQKKEKAMSYLNEKKAAAAPTYVSTQIDVKADNTEKTQRKYLLNRVRDFNADWADEPRSVNLSEMFKTYANNMPNTFEDLIKAIKDGKYEIDKKVQKKLDAAKASVDEGEQPRWGYGVTYGIIFTDLPKPDLDGYYEALNEWHKLVQEVRDEINILPVEQGLASLKKLENWKPSNAPVQ